MRKRQIYRLLHLCLLFNFLVLVASGVMRFAFPFTIEVTRVHMLSGLAMTVLTGFHIVGRLRHMGLIVKPKQKQYDGYANWVTPVVAMLICVLFWSAAWAGWPGASHVVGLSYESRHRKEIVREGGNVASIESENLTQTTKLTSEGASLVISIDWKKQANKAVAIWAETKSGSIIETLYLSEALRFSDVHHWEAKDQGRGDILPIWRNRYTAICGVSPDGQVDLTTGPTKNHKFDLDSTLEGGESDFVIFVEVNGEADGLPSLIYAAQIDSTLSNPYVLLSLIGTGDGSVDDGELNYDVDGISRDAECVDKILVKTRWVKE